MHPSPAQFEMSISWAIVCGKLDANIGGTDEGFLRANVHATIARARDGRERRRTTVFTCGVSFRVFGRVSRRGWHHDASLISTPHPPRGGGPYLLGSRANRGGHVRRPLFCFFSWCYPMMGQFNKVRHEGPRFPMQLKLGETDPLWESTKHVCESSAIRHRDFDRLRRFRSMENGLLTPLDRGRGHAATRWCGWSFWQACYVAGFEPEQTFV